MQLRPYLRSLALIAILSLSACGTQAPASGSGGHGINKAMMRLIQYSEGKLRASADVYGPDGKFLDHRDLEVNLEAGQVYTQPGGGFKLKSGSYTFLIAFYYQVNGLPELPIGLVIKQQAIQDGGLVEWTPEEIFLSNGEISPNLVNGLISDPLPNLDTDSDGINNLVEFSEGSDPTDPASLPNPPELEAEPKLDGYIDEINLDLTFTDSSGVAKIEPVDPVCGYSSQELKPVEGEDLRKVNYQATFNTHAYAGDGTVTLKLKATDVWGSSKIYEFPIKFTRSPNSQITGPEIAILRPQDKETVTDLFTTEAIACDRYGIFSLEPIKGLSGNDNDAKPERFLGSIDSKLLGDAGLQPLSFKAVAKSKDDPNLPGNSIVRNILVNIDNQNAIQIDSPTPGSLINDQVTLIAHVDKSKMPEVTELFVESVTSEKTGLDQEDPELSSLKSNDENAAGDVYKKTLDTSFEPTEREITIRFKAISPNDVQTRTITYLIKNNPRVEFQITNDDGQGSCIQPGSLELSWKVTNRKASDPIQLYGSVDGKSYTLLQDVTNLTDAQGQGQLSRLCQDKENYYRLKALRNNSEASQEAREVQLTKIKPVGLNDNAFIQPGPLAFQLPGLSPTTSWRVELWKEEVKLFEKSGQGPDVDLGVLEPRSLYYVYIQLLNEQGEAVSKSQDYFVMTLDKDLTAWWAINEFEEIGEWQSYISHDYSVNDYAFQWNQGYSWLNPDGAGEGILFTNQPQASGWVPKSKTLHALGNKMSFEALIRIDALSNETYLISKNGEFALGFDQTNFIATLGFKGCGIQGFNEPDKITALASVQATSNGWHHLVITYGNDSFARLYVDGVEDTNKNINQNLNPYCNTYMAVNYLDYPNSNQFGHFKGAIGEMAFYQRALSPAEIKASCLRLKPEICK